MEVYKSKVLKDIAHVGFLMEICVFPGRIDSQDSVVNMEGITLARRRNTHWFRRRSEIESASPSAS